MSTEYSTDDLKLAVKVIYERDYSVLDKNIKRVLNLLANYYYDKDNEIITTEFHEITSMYPIWYRFYSHRLLMNLKIKYFENAPIGRIRALLLTPDALTLIDMIRKMPP